MYLIQSYSVLYCRGHTATDKCMHTCMHQYIAIANCKSFFCYRACAEGDHKANVAIEILSACMCELEVTLNHAAGSMHALVHAIVL